MPRNASRSLASLSVGAVDGGVVIGGDDVGLVIDVIGVLAEVAGVLVLGLAVHVEAAAVLERAKREALM